MNPQPPEVITPEQACLDDIVLVSRGGEPLAHGPVAFDEKNRPFIRGSGAYLGKPDPDPAPREVVRLSKARPVADAEAPKDRLSGRVPDDFDPRCWYSPSKGYYVSVWPGADPMMDAMGFRAKKGAVLLVMHVDTGATSFDLPEDAREIGAAPTQWAYDRACEALKKHRERADNADGRLRLLSDKLRAVVGGDWVTGYMPPEIGVDALIHMYRMTEKPPIRDSVEMIEVLHILDLLVAGQDGGRATALDFQQRMGLDTSTDARIRRLEAVKEG